MTQTCTALLNKLEVAISRGEDLDSYISLAKTYLSRKRITQEEYELVLARIDEVQNPVVEEEIEEEAPETTEPEVTEDTPVTIPLTEEE